MKSWLRTAAVALLAVGLVIAGVIASRRPSTPEDIFRRVSDRLSCRCGCGQHLNGCTHHPCGSADPMREEVRAAIAGGKGEEAIVQEFVEKMGGVILAAPPARGIALTAWIMPVAALLLGLTVIVRLLRSLRARQAAAAAGAGSPAAGAAAPGDPERAALLKRYGATIDEDLERDA